MSNIASKIDSKMVTVTEALDSENEAARLEGSALAGILMGSWVSAAGVAIGYSPFVIASMITVGVVGGIGILAVK